MNQHRDTFILKQEEELYVGRQHSRIWLCLVTLKYLTRASTSILVFIPVIIHIAWCFKESHQALRCKNTTKMY